MFKSPEQDPVAILEDFAARVTSNTADLSASGEPGASWVGVGVRAAGELLVVPLDKVRELQAVPRCTRVPGTQDWLVGLAWIGGRLVSVVDLGALLQGQRGPQEPGRQVVLLRSDAAPTALLVDEVAGLKRFPQSMLERNVSGVPDWLSPYLEGIWRDAETAWGMLDVAALLANPRFRQVLR